MKVFTGILDRGQEVFGSFQAGMGAIRAINPEQ